MDSNGSIRGCTFHPLAKSSIPREVAGGIVIVANLAKLVLPLRTEELGDHWEIELGQLPPGPFAVLVLALDDRNDSALEIYQ
jgi:hypothetical protein